IIYCISDRLITTRFPYTTLFRSFDGFEPVHRFLEREKPDVAVMFYNDHGLNFFLDKMPTFAIGCAPEYRHEDEGWGIGGYKPYRSEEHTSELQSRENLVCRLLLE